MKDKYDVVIIGAGIGGLVCGCYLAKAGLKVLIVEKNDKPGGYCTSFEKDGYRFDVGVHYLGGIKRGILGQILEELDIKDQIKFHQFDPTDKIIMPDNITYIRANPYDTIKEFKKSFPKEKRNIERFFKFIFKEEALKIYKKLQRLTFKKLLDIFFKDFRLKATLSVLIGNTGTSSYIAPAFPCVVLFRQYILDPGYYPQKQIQQFPNILTYIFKKYGGELILSKEVTRIVTNTKRVNGVKIDGEERVNTYFVVSNGDVTQTFRKLLDIKSRESKIVTKMKPAPSMFGVYLGINNKNLRKDINGSHNIYFFDTYNINKAYSKIEENISSNELPWIVCSFPSLHISEKESQRKNSIVILTFAPYKSINFWRKHEKRLTEQVIKKASNIIPNLNHFIEKKFSFTPITFLKYTLNREGSFVGWLLKRKYMRSSLLPQRTSISGLYITGHWSTSGYLPFGGISNVAFLGRRTAAFVLKEKNIKWKYKEFYL